MAIQMRRGNHSDFVPSNLVDGELAVVMAGDPDVSDGKALYVCLGGGTVKKVATWDDAAQLIAANLPDAFDLAIESGNAAITHTFEGDTHTLTHVQPYVEPTTGLNPAAVTSGSKVVAGEASIAYGGGFWVPVIDTDAYGHVTSITYERLLLPSTFSVADADHAGAVWPDLETIQLDSTTGRISVNMASAGAPGLMSTAQYVKLDNLRMSVVEAHVIGSFEYASSWLSDVAGGEPLEPQDNTIYVIVTTGDHLNEMVRWDSTAGEYVKVTASIDIDAAFDAESANPAESQAIASWVEDAIAAITVDVATSTTAGIVKPDNSTITVDADGTIHANAYDASDSAPQMDGAASAGTSDEYARGDHRHPTDTSRAAASDLSSHVEDTTSHITQAERDNWNSKTSSVGTITGISTSSPLSGSGTSGSVTISHAASGVTAGSKGDSSAQTPAFGGKFKALSATVNATGHLTELSEHDVTIPSATASSSSAGLMSASDKAKLDGIDAGANAYSLPTASTTTKGGAKVGTGLSVASDTLSVDTTSIATKASVDTLSDVVEGLSTRVVENYAGLTVSIGDVEDAVSELTNIVLAQGDRITEVERKIESTRRALLVRNDDGYYDNASITAFLAARFDGKLYGYSEPKTAATDIAKTGANAGIPNPTLGTATVAGSSVYRDLGPFQWFAAKGNVDSDGVPHMAVIRGIDSEDAWDACDENVWAMHPVVWYAIDSVGETAVIGSMSDTWHQGLKPNPQAYLPDGTLRPYMVRARYGGGVEDGKLVSKSGLRGYAHSGDFKFSHNDLITEVGYSTSGYSGKSIYDSWYEQVMPRFIYGTKDFQTIMQGCSSYNYQYYPAIAETGVKRVILTNAQAANLLVGSTFMFGTRSAGNSDRNQATIYDIFDGEVLTRIETYDSTRKAVYFDGADEFDTATTYMLTTAPWHSGSCDAMDWDGSPSNPQSAKEVAFFQCCEMLTGCLETLAGVILEAVAGGREIPYVVRDTRKDATSVTSDFVACGDGLPSNTGTANTWKYSLYLADHDGLPYGEGVGTNNTTGVADGQYVVPDTTANSYEFLSLGSLYGGRIAGPSYVNGDNGLTASHWGVGSRLSGTGRAAG